MLTRFFVGVTLASLVASDATNAQNTRRRTRRTAATTTSTTASTPAPAPADISLTNVPANVDAKPQSVVMLPDGPRQQVDTALINPEPAPRRRRFAVKVVPAAPPGRSRQEIMYTDSIANRSPRR